MSDLWNNNELTERHYTSLILRLLLDRQGQLIHGEIVDVASNRQEHFIGDHGLIDAIQAWLTRQAWASTNADPPDQ